MWFIHWFACGTNYLGRSASWSEYYSYLMCYSDCRVVLVSQFCSYAEFNGEFLLRVGIECDIDIRAYFISIGTVYLEFGVITSWRWDRCNYTGLWYEVVNCVTFRSYFQLHLRCLMINEGPWCFHTMLLSCWRGSLRITLMESIEILICHSGEVHQMFPDRYNSMIFSHLW